MNCTSNPILLSFHELVHCVVIKGSLVLQQGQANTYSVGFEWTTTDIAACEWEYNDWEVQEWVVNHLTNTLLSSFINWGVSAVCVTDVEKVKFAY